MDAQLVIDNLEELSDRDARRVMNTALRNLMDRADLGMPITSKDIGIFLNIAADGRLAAKDQGEIQPPTTGVADRKNV